ncbi:uroporphyrinogen decarboxylase [Mariniphaga anaerophila]|uniref:Uroporphyrinogen decarboxylase n=1 Tax=Mariniphaga anaerophila TaxID=1484053 RepID=A0A1M5CCE9_9BACT|nr:uroporphyrinogen decarboxylase family protein [Mariniphaga anaerophila]SHF52395.1 uroporphyrinogen decarboxylase [Mariniphaga anaerophila]
MDGLELIRKAFTLQPTDRIPWVPFVGVHGGFLTGTDAATYLKSAEEIVDGISKSVDLYNPDGIPVVFDLQVEAEALGCELRWSEAGVPAVVSHPLAEGKALSDLQIPGPNDGRIPVCVKAAGTLRKKYPDLALYGLITGPFTLALHLLGTDIFMKLFEAPDEVNSVMEFCTQVGEKMAQYYLEAGCDIIAVVDPMTSQIDPLTFESFVTPFATRIFDYIRREGKLSSFFVCGHAQQNIEAMCNCNPDNISIDENIPLDFVKEVALDKGISFGGNLKLTVVLLMGTPDDCRENALECLDLGGKTGFILAPGCDLPRETPPENLTAVADLVHDPYLQDVTRTLEKRENSLEIFNMKDYGQAEKVIVDVITLDSESCAPCQYMLEAVKRVTPYFDGVVEWREHAIKKMEAVNFMSSLMVKNIPTICIDGKIAFVSQIPPEKELIATIQKRINEKLKLNIKSKKGEFVLLGETENQCNELKERVVRALTETGKEINVRTIIGREKLAAYGAKGGPALVAISYKLKAEGTLPSVDVIKEWLKEL